MSSMDWRRRMTPMAVIHHHLCGQRTAIVVRRHRRPHAPASRMATTSPIASGGKHAVASNDIAALADRTDELIVRGSAPDARNGSMRWKAPHTAPAASARSAPASSTAKSLIALRGFRSITRPSRDARGVRQSSGRADDDGETGGSHGVDNRFDVGTRLDDR